MDVPRLLRDLMSSDLGRPRLTWYSSDERIELSAKVLDNWVAKTANLLVDTVEVGPGTTIAIDLPLHWRTAVWLLGAWVAGAHVKPTGSAEVLVTDRPDRGTRSADVVVAVALPSLASTFGPALPPDAIDAAVEVRSHGDVFLPLVRPAQADLALADLGYGELFAAATADELPPGVRLLVAGEDVPDPITTAPGWLLGPLLRDGSIVLMEHVDAGRIAAQEGVTARFS